MKTFCTSLEEAVENGQSFYEDQDFLAQGRSGGSRCPKCKIWTCLPRKRKYDHLTWLSDCEKCEIKDPFARIWHTFNKNINDDERKLYNEWLSKVRYNLDELNYENNQAAAKSNLKKLVHSIPFFEGI